MQHRTCGAFRKIHLHGANRRFYRLGENTHGNNRHLVDAVRFFVILIIMLAIDLFKIPLTLSLGVVAVIIATSIILSLEMYARERGTAGSIEETNAQ